MFSLYLPALRKNFTLPILFFTYPANSPIIIFHNETNMDMEYAIDNLLERRSRRNIPDFPFTIQYIPDNRFRFAI